MKAIAVALGLAALAGCSAPSGDPGSKPAAGTPAASAQTRVLAYYFHGTVRCEKCLSIEKRARELISSRFAGEVASGRLVFRVVNYDKPDSAHFLTDYSLPCPSLVLVRQSGGKDQEWKLLGQTWENVEVPPLLDDYIEKEIGRFLQPGAAGVLRPEQSGSATAVGKLSELGELASEMNAVLVFVPGRDGAAADSAITALNGAKKRLEAQYEIRLGLFTLRPGSSDYEEIARQMPVPGVVPIVKTGVRRYVSGELTEEKIVAGFLAAVSAGGCCPLGYLGEK